MQEICERKSGLLLRWRKCPKPHPSVSQDTNIDRIREVFVAAHKEAAVKAEKKQFSTAMVALAIGSLFLGMSLSKETPMESDLPAAEAPLLPSANRYFERVEPWKAEWKKSFLDDIEKMKAGYQRAALLPTTPEFYMQYTNPPMYYQHIRGEIKEFQAVPILRYSP